MPDPLVAAVRRYTEARPGKGLFLTEIEGLVILRSDHEKRPDHRIHRPALCIVVQGAKWAMFGEKRIDYRAGQALVVSVEMPAFGRVSVASPDEPYLGIIIEFDLATMGEVLQGLSQPPEPSSQVGASIFVTDFSGPLSDCVRRAVCLLDTPQAIPMLYPLIMREICYWLLTGPHGSEIAKIVLANSYEHRLINAIHALRDHFTEAIRIEDLARIALMSPSAFHRQFKAFTSMTPLHYQKQLRLLEARRLMLDEAVNVETAALQVGYESPSQFSRDYVRMFGAPPRRDIVRLRALAA